MNTFQDILLDGLLSSFEPKDLDERQRLRAAMLWVTLYFQCLSHGEDEQAADICERISELLE